MNIIIQCIVVSTMLSVQTLAYQSCANVDYQAVTKVTNLVGKDFVFAGFFPVKEKGCVKFHKEKGVERMEAMIRAIQLINENNDLLTGSYSIDFDIVERINRVYLANKYIRLYKLKKISTY